MTSPDRRRELITHLTRESIDMGTYDMPSTDPTPTCKCPAALCRCGHAADQQTTRLLVEVTWHGNYYLPSERAEMVRDWIVGALDDRDDSPGVEIRDAALLLDLIKDFAEFGDDPCQFDHHGYCQGHGWLALNCPFARAKELLAEMGDDHA